MASTPASARANQGPLADLDRVVSLSAVEAATDSTTPAPPAEAAPAPSAVAPAPGPSAIAPPADTAKKETPARARGSVNPRKALLLSLLLPGAGELYSGHKGRATGFFVSEGAVWANFAAWEIAGHLRRDNYIEQARLNAGVGTTSESDDYWRLVGAYVRSSGSGDTYEDALRRDARNEFPSDPAAQDAWVAERLPTGNRAWNWTSASTQENYLLTRRNSKRAFTRAKFSFALAILNRLASAIDTQVLHRGDVKADQSAIERHDVQILTGMTADGGGRVLLRQTF
ncbi:MAG TPA: hypothetical protein VER38_00850 [Candidatus Eisenbacteria bacterium]|nr:hypothetical protein [Candidatus Eisenbacteria bacterium]